MTTCLSVRGSWSGRWVPTHDLGAIGWSMLPSLASACVIIPEVVPMGHLSMRGDKVSLVPTHVLICRLASDPAMLLTLVGACSVLVCSIS